MTQAQIRRQVIARIKELRTEREETQLDLAESIGLEREKVGLVERGHRKLTIQEAALMARHFEISLDELVYGSDR
jgi:DNA-binding XRE family transcriptional regulator